MFDLGDTVEAEVISVNKSIGGYRHSYREAGVLPLKDGVEKPLPEMLTSAPYQAEEAGLLQSLEYQTLRSLQRDS